MTQKNKIYTTELNRC